MVGVGLIFIPTLPPPFGEVLIVGGVSVLGTEFEAPKRVMKSARDSMERSLGRELEGGEAPKLEADSEEQISQSGTCEESDAVATSDAAEKKPQQAPKRTMGVRFRNFGRRVVLPFLDQVVGDRDQEGQGADAKHQEEQGNQ